MRTQRGSSGFALLPVVLGLIVLAGVAVLMARQGASLSTAATAASEANQFEELFKAARLRANWELDVRQCGGYTGRTATLGGHQYQFGFSAVEGSPVNLSLTATLQGGGVRTRQVQQERAWDLEQPLQLVSSKTTRMDQNNPENNYDTHQHLKVGGSANKEHRSLIQFDLAAIPAGVRISSATLVLAVETVGLANREVGVRRVTQSWDADRAAWNWRKLLMPWASAGGAEDSTDYGTFMVVANGEVSVDVTNLVDQWFSGRVPNYGLLLRQTSAALGAVTNFTSDSGGGSKPRLDILYRCECGSTCSVDNYAACDAKYRANTETAVFTPSLGAIEGAAAVPADFTVAGITFGADGGYVLADGQVVHGYSAAGALLGSCNVTNNVTGVAYVSAGADRGHLALIRDNGIPRIDYVGAACAVTRSVALDTATLQDPVGIAYLRLEQGHAREHQLVLVSAAGQLEFLDATGASQGLVTPDFAPQSVTDVTQVYNQEYLLLLDAGRDEVVTVKLSGHVEDRYDYGRFTLADAGGLAVDMNTCAHIIGSRQSNRVVSLVRTPLSREPVAHWKLDETAGSTAADSVGTHHGTLSGAPVWVPLSGALQGSLQLTAGGQGVSIADSGSLDFREALTLTGWIRPAVHDAGEPLVGKRLLVDDRQYWLGTENGVPVFRFNDGSEQVLTDGAQLPLDSWSQLAATFDVDAGLARLFVNGAAVASLPVTLPLRGSAAPVRLGSDPFADTRASIDDVRIFKGALTDADVLTLYQESPVAGAGGGGSPPPGCNQEDYADDFGSVSFALSTGSLAWDGPWTEIGESDGANAGDVRVETAPQALQLRDNDLGGEGVERKVDLSQFTSVSLSFDYARFNLEADDYISVSIGDGTPAGWTELARIQGPGTDSTSDMQGLSINLDSHRQSSRYIRFLTYPAMGDDEGAFIDNVRISGCYQ